MYLAFGGVDVGVDVGRKWGLASWSSYRDWGGLKVGVVVGCYGILGYGYSGGIKVEA